MSENKVQYVRLGKSGLRVSVPIFGAMSIGSPKWDKWVLEEDQSLQVLKAAWDRGINTIDTANVYSNGASEKLVAKFIEINKIPRNEIFILTKCFGLVHKETGVRTILHPELHDTPEYVNQAGLSRTAIFNAVEASLSRLNTTYIDLLQIHRFDFKVEPEETMKALHDLVQSGKVRYIGASSMRCWQFALLNEVAGKNGWTKFVSMQSEYSLLYREEEREMNAYCNYHGIGLIPWAPVAGGALTHPFGESTARTEASKGTRFEKKYTDTDKEIIKRVQEVAEKHGKSMAQIASAWVNAKVTSPIIGMSSEKRVEEAVGINGLELTEEEVKYLEEPYEPKVVRGHP
ncbi:Aldo keto reductase [Dendrothele bispora CBS 962.96]|uniref:Aldo keto reductase n=1 Tax=Dendrothele bispora (strain CBS 962.96) TaxID=1314807 RepID=A0A4S8KQD2_DENBC|nr:Aldo keto reductase [Dendrothele bispora CBS 962.96]